MSSPCPSSGWTRRTTAILVLLLAVAGIAKLHYARSFQSREPLADAPYGDSLVYLDEAERHFVADAGEAFYKPPLYSAVLALSEAWTAPGRQAVRGLQLGCGLVLLAGIFKLGQARGGDLAGAVAVVAAMAYAPLTFHETKLLDTTLAMTLALGGVVALDVALARAVRGLALLSGALLGLAGITWAGNLALIAVLAALLFVTRRRRLAIAFACGAALCVAPVLLHNLKTGDLPFVAYGDGYTVLAGNNPNARGIYSLPPGYPDGVVNELAVLRERAARRLGRTPTPNEQRRATYAEAREYLLSDPGRAVELLRDKLRFLVSSREIGDNDLLPREQQRFGLLPAQRLPFLVLLVLGLFGASVSLARPRLVLLGPIAVGTALVLMSYVCSRYRLPMAPYLAVGAGVGVAFVLRRLRARDPQPFPWIAASVALCPCLIAALVQLPYEADEIDASERLFDVVLDVHAAGVAEREGRASAAAAILARSVTAHPDEPAAAAALGSWLCSHPREQRPALATDAINASPADPQLRWIAAQALSSP